jgi:hypothetical protein
MVYKDKTYCSNDKCPVGKCFRKMTKEEKQGAIDVGLPISMADFSKQCELYERAKASQKAVDDG